jgi:hypothetical protein
MGIEIKRFRPAAMVAGTDQAMASLRDTMKSVSIESLVLINREMIRIHKDPKYLSELPQDFVNLFVAGANAALLMAWQQSRALKEEQDG